MLEAYLKRIYEVAQTGDAREESYYSSLEELLRTFAGSTNRKNIRITVLPKKTEAGNPDFRVWDGRQQIVGYIEAKEPLVENLDYVENSKQIERYRHTFPNLILTNFFEFRLYRNGKLVDKVSLARPFIIHELRTVPPVENEDAFLNMLDRFFCFSLPKAYTAESLAVELAKRTSFLRDQVISEELKLDESSVIGFYQAFREYLITGLTKEGFADLYSQTVTFGLFAARTRSKNAFNRKLAYSYVPKTIGMLRDVFKFISLGELTDQMECIVDDISEVLAVADVNEILSKFYHEGKGKDPIYYFYETFLAEYDPEERERRGVYYTPEPVVSYIVRSLDIILTKHFQKDIGFASQGVTVLDPAAGTLTFLAEATKLAVEEFTAKWGGGGKDSFLREHILRNFYAFELMMAPYVIGHLKMSLLLDRLGYSLKENERVKFYLTNTLEMAESKQSSFPGLSSLSGESYVAMGIKKKIPILVILGNPPYSGTPANPSDEQVIIKKGQGYTTGFDIQKDKLNGGYKLVPQMKEAKRDRKMRRKTWIGELVEYYKIIDGQWLDERNPKWLQDDYVKFIRFAQWKIDQNGEGVLGFITNHSYLDNPTFRGMRQSLMTSFNEIYVLDLHGNSLKKERCPDGSKDENVFDIRQGVAVSLFIKRKGLEKKVFHSERWGLREDKYEWLLGNDIKTIEWEEIKPKSEFYLFVPREEAPLEAYRKYPRITEIFPVNGVGMTTARDKFVIDRDKRTLVNRIRAFKNSEFQDDDLHAFFQISKKKGWSIRKAWKMLQGISDDELENYAVPVLYRPFDTQWIFYHDSVVWRTVKRIMRHMMRENLAIFVGRAGQVVGLEKPWNIIFCSEFIEDFNLFYRGGNVNFPLYLYSDKEDMFSHEESQERKPNLNPKLVESLTEVYHKEPTPEEIFYYIYGILYSNVYRSKYAEFLKTDFPRVPFTTNYELFNKMGKCGSKLVGLHLMKSAELNNPIVKFQGGGDYGVGKLRYEEKGKQVHINDGQYFEGIEREVWEYQIGGYQVLDKWLKDREKLSLDDIKHYCRIATALEKTIEIQRDIDNIYLDTEKDII
jgi:hypothetical protein